MSQDAYERYEALIKSIEKAGRQKRVFEDFMVCESDGDIISFVRRLVEELDVDTFDLTDLAGDRKNEAKAIECRKIGNFYMQPSDKRYIKAVEQYNESIALSEDGSENLALAYANRSAVCFALKEYADCLENIRMARQNGYPVHLLPKINRREADCLNFLAKQEGLPFHSEPEQCEPKLVFEPNPKIPHISNCVELKVNAELGRHLVTNRDLNVGDVVIMDKPFSILPDAKLRYTNCDYCLDDKFLTIIPCKLCTITMFCSEECQSKAWKSYHRIECPIIRDLRFLFTKITLSGMKTMLKAIDIFNNNLEELRQFVESIDEGYSNPLQLDWTAIDPKQVFGTIHMLATNQHLRIPSDLIQRSVYAILMSEHFFLKTELGQLCNDAQSRDLIRQLIFRYSQSAAVSYSNLMFVDNTSNHKGEFSHVHLAAAPFPIVAMMNNSCAPNTGRLNTPDGRMVVFVIRPTKKGAQLLDSYKYHHCVDPLVVRQKGLREQYLFKCQCEACDLNYAPIRSLGHAKLSDQMASLFNYAEMERIDEQDQATMLRKIPEYCHMLSVLDSQYPSIEIFAIQEALLKCFGMVYAKQSRKMKYKNLSSF